MLRAWYRFYSQVFNTISWRVSLRASERYFYGIKNERIKLIAGSKHLIIYSLHISCLKKIKPPNWSTRKRWQNCKAILPAEFDATKASAKIYNLQPDWSNQIITVYLIGKFKLWSDIISFHCSEMISYHFTGIIFSHGFITLTSTHNM